MRTCVGLPRHFSMTAGFGSKASCLLTILKRVPPPLEESVLPLDRTFRVMAAGNLRGSREKHAICDDTGFHL